MVIARGLVIEIFLTVFIGFFSTPEKREEVRERVAGIASRSVVAGLVKLLLLLFIVH